MRSARVRKPATGVSLFPFLAVLICTMGALIVLLIMVVQQARVQAHVETREQAEAMPEDGPTPEDLKREREDYEWRREILEKQRAELTQRLAEERNDLGHLEDHIRRLQDEWKQLVAQAEELNRTGKVKPDEKANIDAERDRLKAALELVKQDIDEAQKKVSTKPRSFAIIPYKGPNGTHRRPIYIECRGDAIIFQPEGVMLGPTDFDGPLGPGNPFDAALRATREYLERAGANQGGEPYPLLVVRPDGAVAYALARSAMKSWDDEFGYELIDQDMKLAFPPPDPNLNTTLQRALGDARRRQEMLARVAPSRFKGVGSSRGGGGGEGEGFDEHYGIGTGRGDGSGGPGMGPGGNSRTPGSGGLAGGGSRTGGFGAPGAIGNGGTGKSGAGKPGAGGGPGGGGIGTGPGGVETGTGPGGVGTGTVNSLAGGPGNGGGGAFYSGKPGFGKPGPIASSGASGGPGGTGLTPDGSKSGGSGSGGTGTGTGGGGSNGTGADGATSGNFAASTETGEAPVFGGRPGGGGQFGKPGASNTAGSTFASASGGSSGSSGTSSSGSPGGSPAGSTGGSFGGAAGGSSGGAQFGSQGGMPSLTLGQDPPPDGASDSSSSDKSKDRKPPKGRRRSSNWGLPNSAANAVGYTRPIRVACTAEKFVILPERGDGNAPQVVRLEEQNSPAPIEDFVGAVWKHMDRWGSAGQRAYWKPMLSVQVAPGGDERFAELESQLKGSGLEVKRK